ncbi:class I SAM-dependent methyltransferase [Luteibaculum oceani]|uniref:Class I SAM-dependent methyltransferase n=1 Tax=Luteibaculum oceani TaxID=1294296 RepID=A0A5C6V4W7_9FLAO|nr:class I SAM-dependent methyltransferase [Luteibaculum oceani]TXC78595.1 class I SAM-dependent methyltransferase [Luteibaculum oceani]
MEVSKNWFVEWFNSPFYHILYKDRNKDEAGKFIENLMDFLKLGEDAEIVDLACGKGRHSVKMNQLGYRVLGLDLSEENIAEAKKMENEKLKFDVHDMRLVYPDVEADLVTNFFTSFGYFSNTADNLKTLNAVRKNLKYKGILVIDFLNATKVIKNLVDEEVKEIDGITFHINRTVEQGYIIKTISFEHMNKPYTFHEKVQALELVDFEFLLSNAGFDLRNTFGNYDLKPFRKDSSERLILVAQKR